MANLASSQHEVQVEAGSQLARWLGRSGAVRVSSQHHQGIASPGHGMRVVARSADGLIEAVEGNSTEGVSVVGVQWHPEFLWRTDIDALALLRGFIQNCH